jgi:hypothetical protein
MVQGAIPPEINEKYMALFQEVSYLHETWGIFRQLYASGDDTVDLLNDSAPGFFRLCQWLLADDIILSISRLNDPRRTLGKDNLTLEQLVHSIDAGKHPALRKEMEKLYAEAKDKCKFAKDHRNKRIAHNDLHLKLQGKVRPLPSPTETNIEDALESIRNVMNAVSRYFHNSEIATVNYYHLVTRLGDGTKIISRLREAEAFRNQRPEQPDRT